MIQKEIITVSCPNCKKIIVWDKSVNPWRPFCSKRCQLIDLGQWLLETKLNT